MRENMADHGDCGDQRAGIDERYDSEEASDAHDAEPSGPRRVAVFVSCAVIQRTQTRRADLMSYAEPRR